MKERPFLFNGPMVCAILDGRKTQTRRIIRDQSIISATEYDLGYCRTLNDGRVWWSVKAQGEDHFGVGIGVCPYGVPGDRLWVRETWRIMGLMYEEEPCIQYKADLAEQFCSVPDDWLDTRWEDWYERQSVKLVEDCERAGLEPEAPYSDVAYRWERDTCPTRWQPSIHLPKFASRIWLEVTGVRVERLQEISEADAYAEGCDEILLGGGLSGKPRSARAWFKDLWDSINAKRHYGWDTNPWVWVVELSPIAALEETG